MLPYSIWGYDNSRFYHTEEDTLSIHMKLNMKKIKPAPCLMVCPRKGGLSEMVWTKKAHPEGHACFDDRFYRESLHKHKINRQNQTHEGSQMIPMQGLALEEDSRKYGKDNQGDYLLDDLQLHQCERTSILHETDSVGGNLEKVLEKGDRPRKSHYTNERKGFKPTECLLHLQVTIPGEGHKDV